MTIAEFINKYKIELLKVDSIHSRLIRRKTKEHVAQFAVGTGGSLSTHMLKMSRAIRVTDNPKSNAYRRKAWRWLGSMEAFNELLAAGMAVDKEP